MNFDTLTIGHTTNMIGGTGITVFLFDTPAACGWWLCGSAPATRDVNLLDPAATVERVDAFVFTGGSAYGLGATNGVMQWLRERGRGYQTRFGVVPIVPTAGIFDFRVKGMAIPIPEDAYHACEAARRNNTLQGRVGAGTGASVGKWFEAGSAMSGGFGYAQCDGANGLKVLSCAVVNSVGDVIDEHGQVVAGAVNSSGKFADVTQSLLAGYTSKTEIDNQNTTLVAVFTNASLDKNRLTRVAKMASAGLARGTKPAFTRYDGDVVFTAALGNIEADEVTVGALAAEATHKAILNAVQDAVVL